MRPTQTLQERKGHSRKSQEQALRGSLGITQLLVPLGASSPLQQHPDLEGGDVLGAKDTSSMQEAAAQTSGFPSPPVPGAFGRCGFLGAGALTLPLLLGAWSYEMFISKEGSIHKRPRETPARTLSGCK